MDIQTAPKATIRWKYVIGSAVVIVSILITALYIGALIINSVYDDDMAAYLLFFVLPVIAAVLGVCALRPISERRGIHALLILGVILVPFFFLPLIVIGLSFLNLQVGILFALVFGGLPLGMIIGVFVPAKPRQFPIRSHLTMWFKKMMQNDGVPHTINTSPKTIVLIAAVIGAVIGAVISGIAYLAYISDMDLLFIPMLFLIGSSLITLTVFFAGSLPTDPDIWLILATACNYALVAALAGFLYAKAKTRKRAFVVSGMLCGLFLAMNAGVMLLFSLAVGGP